MQHMDVGMKAPHGDDDPSPVDDPNTPPEDDGPPPPPVDPTPEQPRQERPARPARRLDWLGRMGLMSSGDVAPGQSPIEARDAVAQLGVTPFGDQEGADTMPVPWHLDRLDGGNSTDPLDQAFRYNGAAGQGVRVYVMDAGVTTHQDLAGSLLPTAGFPHSEALSSLRKILGGAFEDAEWGEAGVFAPSRARASHGTHVASTIGGSRYGVAKHADIVSAQVLRNAARDDAGRRGGGVGDKNGAELGGAAGTEGAVGGGGAFGVAFGGAGISSDTQHSQTLATGPASLFLLALDWVVSDCRSTRHRCVINLSYGGLFSGDLLGWFSIPESALRTVEAQGILVVKSAGNDAAAACNVYPAASRSGVSVGAVGPPDASAANAHHLAPFSNFGCCSDIFAPGVGITAASAVAANATQEASGTSMAAAMASGVAALLWSEQPASSADQVPCLTHPHFCLMLHSQHLGFPTTHLLHAFPTHISAPCSSPTPLLYLPPLTHLHRLSSSRLRSTLPSHHLCCSPPPSHQVFVSLLCLAATDVVAGVCACDGGTCVQGSGACSTSLLANATALRLAGPDGHEEPAAVAAAIADALATPNRLLFNGAGMPDGSAARARYLQCLGFDRAVWGFKPCLVQDTNSSNITNGSLPACEDQPSFFNTSSLEGSPGGIPTPPWGTERVAGSELIWPQAFHYRAINSTWVWAGDCESGIEHWAAELRLTPAAVCSANLSLALDQIRISVLDTPANAERAQRLLSLPLADGLSPASPLAFACAYTCAQVGAGPCVPGWDPHPLAEVGGCHPAGATLELQSGKRVPIESAELGMRVQTTRGFEPILGRLHAERFVTREYFRFVTAHGEMRISLLHWLVCNGRMCDPALVAVGDELSTPYGTARVLGVSRVLLPGAYHITTPSGTYFIDGHLATTYMAVVPFWAWRLFGDGYVCLRGLIGLPVTPEGEGPLSIFWPYALWQLLGVPEAAVPHLWPLTMGGTLLAELLNTAHAHAGPLLLALVAGVGLPRITGRRRGSQKLGGAAGPVRSGEGRARARPWSGR
jgi:subtilisin family serine protease